MPKSARIKINSPGAIDVLQDVRVAADLLGRGGLIASAAGPGFEAVPGRTGDRVSVIVRTTDNASRKAEAERRALSRAVNAGRR